MRRLAMICIAAMLLSSLAGCTQQTNTPAQPETARESSSDSVIVNESSSGSEASGEASVISGAGEIYTERDLAGTWDEAEAVEVALSGTTAEANGSGLSVEDGLVTVSAEGIYVLSGDFTGQIVVDADKQAKVQLVLSGARLCCADGPAIWVQSADKVFLTLAEGTENTVTDGTVYTLEEGEDEPDGAIFSKEDLTINGSGSLTVTASYMDGIVSKDDLKICGGVITVTAADDGLRGKDSVAVCAGSVNVQAAGDGIKSTNADEEGKGWICIEGGSLQVQVGQKGIKAETELTVSGGTLNLKCTDDALHSNGNVTITDGNLVLSSGDDGVHADETLTVSGGRITVVNSYEGLEGYRLEIHGGELDITASDDGLNAAGGSDTMGMMPQDPFSGDSDIVLLVDGGTLTVNAGGDGLDSNGYLYINGGTVWVNGPTDGGNGALDYGIAAEISGGTIVAAGSIEMAEGFSEDSSQPSIMITFSSAQSAGTAIGVYDVKGNMVLSYAPTKAYQHVVLSSPELVQGQTYTLTCGDQELFTLSIEKTITSVDDSGNEVSGMGGFGGGFGGGGGPDAGFGGGGPGGSPGGFEGGSKRP